jgi:hypothetical protein
MVSADRSLKCVADVPSHKVQQPFRDEIPAALYSTSWEVQEKDMHDTKSCLSVAPNRKPLTVKRSDQLEVKHKRSLLGPPHEFAKSKAESCGHGIRNLNSHVHLAQLD